MATIETSPGVRARMIAVQIGLERIIGEITQQRDIAYPLAPDVLNVDEQLKDARYTLASALREVRLTLEAHNEAAGR